MLYYNKTVLCCQTLTRTMAMAGYLGGLDMFAGCFRVFCKRDASTINYILSTIHYRL